MALPRLSRIFRRTIRAFILSNVLERWGWGLRTWRVSNLPSSARYDYVFEMDADFSHNPKELLNFLLKMQEYDLVIGSRYIRGVSVVYWPFRRLLLSYFANLYTRVVTGLPVKDATAGFKCYRRAVLENINLDELRSNGYAFQIEMNYKAWKKGFRLCEIPIIFVDHDRGVSKMSKNIVYEAAFMVWKLKLRSLFKLL